MKNKFKLNKICLCWLAICIGMLCTIIFLFGHIDYIAVAIDVIACTLFCAKTIRDKSYISETLVVSVNHTPVYDYLRCLAVFLVILLHVVRFELSLITDDIYGNVLYKNIFAISVFSLMGNMLFVMLSGTLLLRYRDESVVDYVIKRFSKVFVPLFLYFFLYYYFYVYEGTIERDTIGGLFRRFFTGDINSVEAPHFWLIYVIIFLYVVFYFLRSMLKDISYHDLSLLVVATVVFSALIIFVPYSISDILSCRFLGWILASIVGFWVSKDETRKYDFILIIAGIISIGIMFFSYYYLEEAAFYTYLDNLSPFRYVVGIGIFALFLHFKDFLKASYLIRLISKYSYGIMLIHYLVIYIIYRRDLRIVSCVMYHGLGTVVVFLQVLAFSLILAFLIDNTYVSLLQSIISLMNSIPKRKENS